MCLIKDVLSLFIVYVCVDVFLLCVFQCDFYHYHRYVVWLSIMRCVSLCMLCVYVLTLIGLCAGILLSMNYVFIIVYWCVLSVCDVLIVC